MVTGQKVSGRRLHAGQVITIHVAEATLWIELGDDGVRTVRRTTTRPRKHSRRWIVNAVLNVVRTGCVWRQVPADFPSWQTVHWYFVRWERQRFTLRMLDVPRPQVRQGEAVTPTPSLGPLAPRESTQSWLTTHRRPARGYERRTATSAAVLSWAAITLMTRRRPPLPGPAQTTRRPPNPLSTNDKILLKRALRDPGRTARLRGSRRDAHDGPSG
ncbi:transposase [Actinomadura luteofluorescens]|uniref:transposase n=1 Tax=Actinomadura luteofluorescens TaxID=46163 RepID=UPI00346F0134